MKTHPYSIGKKRIAVGLLSSLAAMLTGGLTVHAQVNEKKIERDAIGVYNGTASGASYYVTYDDGSPSHGGTIDPISARVRVPVKDGKLSSNFSDADLPSGQAAAAGSEKRSDVTRNGRRIMVKATGSLNLFESATKGIWTGGLIQGTLDDKGPKWKANTKASAKQRNQSDPLLPADHTKKVTGMILQGNG
jgi:hypothetical protein